MTGRRNQATTALWSKDKCAANTLDEHTELHVSLFRDFDVIYDSMPLELDRGCVDQ